MITQTFNINSFVFVCGEDFYKREIESKIFIKYIIEHAINSDSIVKNPFLDRTIKNSSKLG